MQRSFFARRALLVLMAVFFLVPFGLRGAKLSLQRMKNNVADWLPDAYVETAVLDWFRQQFVSEQFILLSFPGCTEDDPHNRIELLAQKMVPKDVPPVAIEHELFTLNDDFHDWGQQQEKWLTGRDNRWYYITPNGSLFLWKGSNAMVMVAVRNITRWISGPTELKGTLIGQLDTRFYENPRQLNAPLFKTIETGPRLVERLTRPGGALVRSKDAGAEEIQRAATIAKSRLSRALYGPNGKQTCLIATLTDVGKIDLRRTLGRGLLGRPQGRIYNLAEEAGIRPEDLKLGGPPVDNVSIDEEGEITLARLIWLCALVGIGLSYVCFGSFRLTTMVFFVGSVSGITSLGIVYWMGSSVDAILMSMPAVVYVLGLSGAVHIVNYYGDAATEHGLHGASERAVSYGWRPCTLAALTTAIGLLSLCTSDILPIRKFGFFSAIGVLATLGLLFTYLPAALQMWPPNAWLKKKKQTTGRKNPVAAKISQIWHQLTDRILHYNVWVTIGCSIAFLALGYGLTKINTSIQLMKMFDSGAKVIQDYRWLETHLGELVPMELVIRVPNDQLYEFSNQESAAAPTEESQNRELKSPWALTFLERMEIADHVRRSINHAFGPQGQNICGSAMSAVTFGPKLPGPGRSTNAFIERSVTSRILEENRQEFLDSEYLAIDEQTKAELWRISLRVKALVDIDYGAFVSQLTEAVEPVMLAYQWREKILTELKNRQNSEGTQSNVPANVYVLGVPYSRYQKSAQASMTTSSKNSSKSDQNTNRANINQTQIFATTLTDLLLNARVRFDYHDPELVALSAALPEKTKSTKRFQRTLKHHAMDAWRDNLKNKDCVIVVGDYSCYDIDYINENSRLVVDVRKHHADPITLSKANDQNWREVSNISAIYTGVVPLVYKAQRTLLTSLIWSTGLAFAIIAVVMVLVLRNPLAGLVSMIPNAFPVVVIFGLMGWTNVLVDIGTMMTASVAMGVAVDDTVHFLTWFRRGLDQGLNRPGAIRMAYDRCSAAMLQTTAIGGLGLMVFALSTFTPTQRFGYLMCALLVAALVGDLIFLPALLASPLGRVFERKSPKFKTAPTTKSAEDQQANDDVISGPHHGRTDDHQRRQRLRTDKAHRPKQ